MHEPVYDSCPACGDTDARSWAGILGSLAHFVCDACAHPWSRPATPVELDRHARECEALAEWNAHRDERVQDDLADRVRTIRDYTDAKERT